MITHRNIDLFCVISGEKKMEQLMSRAFFSCMQITRVIYVINVALTQAYRTCAVCAFHSLIAEALRQIDYAAS